MYIIQLEPFESGARSPLQTWNKPTAPDGYAFCPDAFYDVFYSTSPAGFVNITVEPVEIAEDVTVPVVTAMVVNQEALDAYLASLPADEPTEEEPSEADDTASMLIDHEYRLTLLELGLTDY